MSTHTLTTRGAFRKSDMRQANERLVLNLIRQTPGISRSDLVRMTGFRASSITFIINRMMRGRLLCEAPLARRETAGRRPVGLSLRKEAMVVIGVEIARGQARVVAADVQGRFLASRIVGRQADPTLFLVKVREAIAALARRFRDRQLLGVGVSLPGTIDRGRGTVIADENQGWFNVEAGRILSPRVEAPFYFENDARLGALAERWFCDAGTRPLRNFIFVMTNPGLGTGVIIDGRLLHGAWGEASEFGHTILFPDGRKCVCGNTGCWEEYASGRALERLYRERKKGRSGGPQPDAERIVVLARAGEAAAVEALRQAAVYLGLGFVNLSSAFNPEAIVVSDYISAGWDLMEGWVWQTLRSRLAPHSLAKLRILRSRQGADSVLMGTLALTLVRYFSQSGSSNGMGALESSVSLEAI